MSLSETAGKLRGGTLRSRDLVEQCLARIAEWQPITNAFIEVDADQARRSADQADADLQQGVDRGVLHGVPVALKDLLDQRGHVTTAGSRSMTTVAAEDAPAVAHLRAQGAVFIGRTNMHEFALGTTSEDSGFGPVRHPFNHLHSAGGSSGGSAVAVSTGMSAVAIGSDTGGSIRIPSAACGLVGLKPAWGEVSLVGVVPLSPTVDCVGPLATSVEDAWYALQGLRHAGALPACPPARSARGLRIGVLRDLGWRRVAEAIGGQLNDAIGWLAGGGAIVQDVSMITTALIAPTYSTIVMREAIDFHAPRLPAHAAGYTPAVRERLQTAPRPSDEEYAAAIDTRARIEADVAALLARVDVLALPGLSVTPPLLGQSTLTWPDGDQLTRVAMLRCTQPFNLSRHPAIVLPVATTPDGWPVSLQLVARDTPSLVAAALGVEAALAAR